MKNKFIKNLTILFISLIVSIFGVYFLINNSIKEKQIFPVYGASFTASTSGWAWSSNFGWISMNCVTDPAFACSQVDNSQGDYGVGVEQSSGKLRGYAWSPNVGWIFFGPDDFISTSQDVGNGYGTIDIANAPADPDNPKNWPYLDSVDKRIKGWAKVLSMGDDGWISFYGKAADASTYGVEVPNIADGTLTGHAWMNTDVDAGVGWISFNCANEGSCASSNYKVRGDFNTPPTASFVPMEFPGHCDFDCACGTNSIFNPRLEWNYSDGGGGIQAGFQVIFATSIPADLDALTDPGVGLPLKTGYIASPATAFYPRNNSFRENLSISPGQQYYWWVKVFDAGGLDSGWLQFSDPADKDGDGNHATFTNYSREFPKPMFTYVPKHPSVGEIVKFEDKSQYDSGGGSFQNCDSTNCSIFWEFSNSETSTKLVASTTFSDVGNFYATSTVSDNTAVFTNNAGFSENYKCSTSTAKIQIDFQLPTWIEGR